MRLAFVTAEYPPKNIGGAGISSQLIVKALRRKGIDVDVFALTGDSKTFQTASNGYHELPSGDLYKIPEEIGENISIIHKLPRLSEYDVVHSYNTGHLPATVTKVEPPIIGTINNHMWVCIDPIQFLKEGCPSYSFTRMFRYAQSTGYNGWQRIGRCVLELIGKTLARRADYITVQTDGMKMVLDHCGFDTNNVFIVPNILDERFDVSSERNPGIEKQTLLFLGRLIESKGPKDAVKAFIELDPAFHKEWRFELYGKGPLSNDISNMIKSSSDRVDIELNYASYEKLPIIYAQADALIHPSKYTEPFSRTWLEAMASETPIICSRNPSSKSVLEGIAELYDPFETSEPKNTLSNFLDSKLDKRSQKAKSRLSKYRSQYIAKKYIQIYKNAIS